MSITRSEVIRRAATMWPGYSVPYSQDTIHPGTGYRQDCSGFVSMCWGIPPQAAPGGWGGLNTVTLVTGGWMREISPSDLQPGDAVGICGPNTGGDDGHIVLFERWASDAEDESRYWAYEQAGGGPGPRHRIIAYPYGGSSGAWRAYRFRDITDGGSMAEDPFLAANPVASRKGRTYADESSDSANMRDWWIGNGGLPPGFPSETSPVAKLLAGATAARAVLAELAGLRAAVVRLEATAARLEARPSDGGAVTPEQVIEIARLVDERIAARMRE